MSGLDKLLAQLENEKAEALIAENAARDAQQKIVSAILAGETTGDYVKDVVLAMELSDEDVNIFTGLQQRLLGAVGKLVMVVERWYEYKEVAYASNMHLRTALSFGVLTEPRFYIALSQKDGVVSGPWYLPVQHVCRFLPEKKEYSAVVSEKLSALHLINSVLSSVLFSGLMYDTNGELMKRWMMDNELMNGPGPRGGRDIALQHLRFCIGEDEVLQWASARNERRVQQVRDACRLLSYPLPVIHNSE